MPRVHRSPPPSLYLSLFFSLRKARARSRSRRVASRRSVVYARFLRGLAAKRPLLYIIAFVPLVPAPLSRFPPRVSPFILNRRAIERPKRIDNSLVRASIDFVYQPLEVDNIE